MEVSSWHDLTGRVFLAAGSGAVSPRGGGKGSPGRHAPGVGSRAWGPGRGGAGARLLSRSESVPLTLRRGTLCIS